MKTTTLYRPVGPAELQLIVESGYRRFPPRLPEQPIFYPVTNERYAIEIAERWNAKSDGGGFVTRFEVQTDHLARYAPKIVGASYSAVQNEIVLRYMREAGFDVLAMAPLEAPFKAVGLISPQALYAHVKRLFLANPGADAVYIQGSGWRTLDIIETLERDLGVPVVHAVASKAWEIMKRLKVNAPREGYGALMRDLPDLRD